MICEAFWVSIKPAKMCIMSTDRFENKPLRPIWARAPFFWRSGGYRKTSNLRNGPPMMLMMLAPPRGLHHQHHWGSVSPIWRYQAATIYQAAAILFFRVLYDGFWLAPGGVKLKMTTSGPNPWFWAREPGFGPDVVILGVLGGCVARP